MNKKLIFAILVGYAAAPVMAHEDDDDNDRRRACDIPAATVHHVQSKLAEVVKSGNGGLFIPNQM